MAPARGGRLADREHDEPALRQLVSHILEAAGYETLEATNGADALEVVERRGAELAGVILDTVMPVMDGMTCAREIRDTNPGDNKDIPIIAITGNAKNYSMEDFKAAGIDDFLPKPLNYDNMVEKVKSFIEN